MWVLWDPHIIRVRNEDAYRSCARYFLLSICPERERERVCARYFLLSMCPERERERERERGLLYDIGAL